MSSEQLQSEIVELEMIEVAQRQQTERLRNRIAELDAENRRLRRELERELETETHIAIAVRGWLSERGIHVHLGPMLAGHENQWHVRTAGKRVGPFVSIVPAYRAALSLALSPLVDGLKECRTHLQEADDLYVDVMHRNGTTERGGLGAENSRVLKLVKRLLGEEVIDANA